MERWLWLVVDYHDNPAVSQVALCWIQVDD